ncbi:MAG: mechanosensitive ion channel family protein [Nitrospiraceae bacterium]|nr:mechanosensitive ion channel family protein [Nitrospiraceae bacterium]OQW64649.1 MAG: mechanosensitive ion channel protein MscS [Nitrospira sp. ST-bin5]
MQEVRVAQLADRLIEWTLSSGIRVVLIGFGMILLLSLSKQVITRFRRVYEGSFPGPAQVKRVDTLTHVVRDVARVFILVVGSMMILSEIGIDLKPLLAAAGLSGLAIGFGAQSLVKDVISGFFILLENSVRVGDVVEVAGVAGVVEEVKLRTITLRDLSGNVHVVPNGIVDKVKNMTKVYSYYLFDVGVAYRENVDEVMAVLKEIAEELREDPAFNADILEPLDMLGVDQFADSAVIIKCRIKTNPMQQWRIGREMNRRIKNTFDAKGIEIPFPHRTIYWRDPSQAATMLSRSGA